MNTDLPIDRRRPCYLNDIGDGAMTPPELARRLEKGSVVVLRGRAKDVALGTGLLLKVNTNLGVSEGRRHSEELVKLKAVATALYRPDAIMDLSIRRVSKPLYRVAIEDYGLPVGTLPHYLCYSPRQGFDKQSLLEEIHRQAEAGVAWMTVHPTPRQDILEVASKERFTPYIARGGGLVVRDLILNRRDNNIFHELFDDMLEIFRRYQMVISIGATFRPSTTIDALDRTHLMELECQGHYIQRARAAGVGVILEGIGHITLEKLERYVRMVKARYDVPFVPLGPMPTDAAIGEDHIASAIGAAFIGMMDGASMINSVTREEHTGDVPSRESVLEGLRAARVAAHVVNIAKFPQLNHIEAMIGRRRGSNHTCVVDGGLFSQSSREQFALGCTRCREECPLMIDYLHRQAQKGSTARPEIAVGSGGAAIQASSKA